MAIISFRKATQLGPERVLAPERYDPRRSLNQNDGTSVGEVAIVVRKVIVPGAPVRHCSVFDTSDAYQGVVGDLKSLVQGEALGSAKKEAIPSDVVISRLRPYLRQVAFVDADLVSDAPEGTRLLFSTEFFVLRSKSERSIAFLVPFLLSGVVQSALAAAQEGGHHPRINEDTILSLPIPPGLLAQRDQISRAVEDAVGMHRSSVRRRNELVRGADTLLAIRQPQEHPVWAEGRN